MASSPEEQDIVGPIIQLVHAMLEPVARELRGRGENAHVELDDDIELASSISLSVRRDSGNWQRNLRISFEERSEDDYLEIGARIAHEDRVTKTRIGDVISPPDAAAEVTLALTRAGISLLQRQLAS